MPDNAPSSAASPALDRIFSAAGQLFAGRGFNGVSISDVAREAGVCKANVFHHFATKQALYQAVLTRACEELGDEIERSLSPGADPALQVPHFLVGYRDYLRAHPATARLVFGEVTGNPDLAESSPVFAVLARLLDNLVARLRDARDAGVFRADMNPTVVASLMLGMTLFNSQSEHWRTHMPAWRDVSDETYVDLLTDVLMHGVHAGDANAVSVIRNVAT
jgi:TetR/AcrR family transcriptional regulator